MESPLQNIVDNFDKYRIGLDDVFAFRCRSCGKCCKNRDDILLNSRDVYNLATSLKLTHKQAIEQYCEVYIGQDSRLPIVRLKPKGVNRVCPLLKGTRCSIHASKPSVCALYPIGRISSTEDAPKELGLGNLKEIQYIVLPIRCASLRRKQTVRAWLEAINMPIDDSYFHAWNEALVELIKNIKKFENASGAGRSGVEMLWGAIYQAVYTDYDTSKEFRPQFDYNMAKILKLFERLQEQLKNA